MILKFLPQAVLCLKFQIPRGYCLLDSSSVMCVPKTELLIDLSGVGAGGVSLQHAHEDRLGQE